MRLTARFSLLFVLLAGFVCVTTYPYTWLTNLSESGMGYASFAAPGMLLGTFPAVGADTEQVSIHLRVKASATNQKGPARILTISRNHDSSNLTIGQEGPDLVIRLRRAGSSPNGQPPFLIQRFFATIATQAVKISMSKSELAVTTNGTEVFTRQLDRSPFTLWDPHYRLALGNEHTWERPWLGEITDAHITVDETKTDLLSTGSVTKPGILHPLIHKWTWFSDSAFDLVMNFFAMVPLGAMTASIFAAHRVRSSVFLWLLVVVLVEMTQGLIYGRYPGLSDLVLNVAGVGTGAWLLASYRRGNVKLLRPRS